MNSTGKLTYLRHREIDFAKWDECLDRATNSRVYAATWYLDRTAVVWDALVWGDYGFVMPLPVKKKLGISYLYQPLYCQQLGIFPPPPPEIATAFFACITRKFRYVDYQFNSNILPPKNQDEMQFLARKNFLLLLGTDYPALSNAFAENTHRNIVKAGKNGLSYVEGISLEDFLDLKQKNTAIPLSETAFQKLKSIIAYSQYKGIGEIIGVYSSGNVLSAAVFFLRWKSRVIYMNSVSSPRGKEDRAMFFLMDQFLRSIAGKNFTLDFEGSMVPGVARFFEGFGATPETYYRLKVNRLPVPFNWLKRDL